jgi:hypothetical protein
MTWTRWDPPAGSVPLAPGDLEQMGPDYGERLVRSRPSVFDGGWLGG